jgi:hypothetical protein
MYDYLLLVRQVVEAVKECTRRRSAPSGHQPIPSSDDAARLRLDQSCDIMIPEPKEFPVPLTGPLANQGSQEAVWDPTSIPSE